MVHVSVYVETQQYTPEPAQGTEHFGEKARNLMDVQTCHKANESKDGGSYYGSK